MKKTFTLLSISFLSFSFAQTAKTSKVEQTIKNNNRTKSLQHRNAKSVADNSAFGFETSEGFILGSVDNQNYWFCTKDTNNKIQNNQLVVNDVNYAGSQSLALSQDPNFGEQLDQGSVIATIGSYYSKATLSSDNVEFVMMPITTDAKSMYQISIADYTNKLYRDQITIFSDDNTIYVTDFDAGKYVSSLVKVSPNTWYKVKVEYTTSKVNYYIDGKVVFSRTSSGTSDQISDYIDFMHSNSTTSTKLRIDNVILGKGVLSTSDVDKSAKIKIYPNPASDFLSIETQDKIESITIGDLSGRTVKYIDQNQKKINIQSLPAGVYLLKIKTEKGLQIEKIVKK